MRTSEEGMVTMLGISLLAVMLMLGMALMYMARNCTETERIFRDEAQLRLAAESGMEEAAEELSKRDADDVADMKTFPDVECVYDREPLDGIHVMAYATRRGERIELLARASRSDPVSGRTSYRSVHGCMERSGERYVWHGWLP